MIGIQYVWGAIITAVVALTSLLVNNIYTNSREKRQHEREKQIQSLQEQRFEFERKERYISRLLSTREKSNSKIYLALVNFQNYLYPFINPGNEFKESKDIFEFASLSEVENIQKLFDSVEIWLHRDTITRLQELMNQFNLLNNAALNIALHNMRNEDDEEFRKVIVDTAEKNIETVIELINEMKVHIRKISGGEALDKYVDEVIHN